MTPEQIFQQWQDSNQNMKQLRIQIHANREKYYALWNEFDELDKTDSPDSETVACIQVSMNESQGQYWVLSEKHEALMNAHDNFYQQHQAAVAQELASITGSNKNA